MVAREALVVDPADVLVLEPGDEVVLAHEALEEHRVAAQAAVEDLEGYAQPVAHALGEVHLGLAAAADDVHDGVARDYVRAPGRGTARCRGSPRRSPSAASDSCAIRPGSRPA